MGFLVYVVRRCINVTSSDNLKDWLLFVAAASSENFEIALIESHVNH